MMIFDNMLNIHKKVKTIHEENMQIVKTWATTHISSIIVRVSIYKYGQPMEESIVGKDWSCKETSLSILPTNTLHTYIHSMEVIAEGIQKNSQAKKLIFVSKHRA